MNDIIVNFAPTGMIPTKEMTPYVPISVSEIIDDVLKASEIGITMAHIHARDEQNGEPTWKPEIYGKIIQGIRKYDKDLILGISTSGRTFSEIEKRSAPLFLTGDQKPDMGSLTLSSLNFNKIASLNQPEVIVKLATIMLQNGIKPELEAFDAGMINFSRYLINRNVLKPPYYFNLILGNIACAQADLLHAGVMLRDLPENSFWSFAGIGDWQFRMNSVAIAMGGGVRFGLEDNIWYDLKRKKLVKNIGLLKRLHGVIAVNERNVMSPLKLRKLLGLTSSVQ